MAAMMSFHTEKCCHLVIAHPLHMQPASNILSTVHDP